MRAAVVGQPLGLEQVQLLRSGKASRQAGGSALNGAAAPAPALTAWRGKRGQTVSGPPCSCRGACLRPFLSATPILHCGPHLQLQQQALRGLAGQHAQHQGGRLPIVRGPVPALVVVLVVVGPVGPAQGGRGSRGRVWGAGGPEAGRGQLGGGRARAAAGAAAGRRGGGCAGRVSQPAGPRSTRSPFVELVCLHVQAAPAHPGPDPRRCKAGGAPQAPPCRCQGRGAAQARLRKCEGPGHGDPKQRGS